MLRLDEIASNLIQLDDGMWTAKSESRISYPEDGNEECLGLEESSFWFNHRNSVLVSIVKRFRPAGPVFDIGGGNGYVTKGLCDAGIEAVLVEPGRGGALNGRRRGLEVIRSTLTDAGFRPNVLSSAGIFDVLEHIEDADAFLGELNSVLVPGGYLYVAVPAFRALWSAQDHLAGHHRRYTRTSLRRALRTAGFQVRYSSYMFAPLPPAIFLFRALPSRLRLKGAAMRERTQAHHSVGGVGGRLLRRLLAWERAHLTSGGTLPVGSSCIAVGQKALL